MNASPDPPDGSAEGDEPTSLVVPVDDPGSLVVPVDDPGSLVVPVDDRKRAANRDLWDARVPIHVASQLYDVPGFLAGQSRLRPFEPEELGPVDGRDLVHLQCHFGLDTLSWARLGARVTGLDFSAPGIEAARRLATEAGLEADFVTADVYQAVAALGGQRFDVVYTGLGALNWLGDLDGWAEVVAALVRPGGVLYLVEFSPLHDILDDDLRVEQPYFGSPVGRRWDDVDSYTDGPPLDHPYESWEWTHPTSEVISSILDVGMALDSFHEHPFTLWPRWPWLEAHDDGTWWIPADRPSLPLIYSLKAHLPA